MHLLLPYLLLALILPCVLGLPHPNSALAVQVNEDVGPGKNKIKKINNRTFALGRTVSAGLGLTIYYTAKHLQQMRWYQDHTGYQRDFTKDKYSDVKDIRDRLTDPGLDHLNDVRVCVEERMLTAVGPHRRNDAGLLTLQSFLEQYDTIISITEYKMAEKFIDGCIDHVNRLINRHLAVRDPDNLDPKTLKDRLKAAGLEKWQEERKSRSPGLYEDIREMPHRRHRVESQSNGGGGDETQRQDSFMGVDLNAQSKKAGRWFGQKMDNARQNGMSLAATVARAGGGKEVTGGPVVPVALPAGGGGLVIP
ncbi:MAG: hypothetical protein M1816_007842 [Peltula sp. TS41687]|nr:MAG: hypothetical protein M1816_007842 [Peltula sp. TS41687]